MDFYPCQDQAFLPWWHGAFQQFALAYREYGFAACVFGMNVRQFVLLGVKPVHVDQDAVKRADERHGTSPLRLWGEA